MKAIPRISTAHLNGAAIFAVIIAALLFSACGDVATRTLYRGGTEFMPLMDGRKLRYHEKGNGESYDYSLTMKYIGGRAWKVYVCEDEGTPYGGIEFSSNGVIVEAATRISFTSMESRTQVSAFNQIWVDEGAALDSAWYNEQTGTETIVAGFETVTVPAGKFEDCLKTVVTPLPAVADSIEARYQRNEMDEQAYSEERGVANWQTVRWFAQGVGLVKEQIGPPGEVKIVRELLAVDAEGAGKVDSFEVEQLENNGSEQ